MVAAGVAAAWHLVTGWYAQIWPNLAASGLGVLWLDARNAARHLEAMHARPVTQRKPRGYSP